MPEGYLEVSLRVRTEDAAAIAERLQSLAPGGVAIEEPVRPLGPDEGVRFEPWRPTILRIYLPIDAELAARRLRLATEIAQTSAILGTEERTVQEEDWAESWKVFFQVEHAGQHLVIRPTWRQYQPAPGDLVLDLDPGMAFGTGQHPTTRLCLAQLEQFVAPGASVLDLGCGSGILALAAARLGAKRVLALDTEPVAVEAARANVRLNGLELVVQVKQGSLDESWPESTPPDSVADLIVANINASTIASLAPAIAWALRGEGVFIGSGIIDARLDETLLALTAAGVQLDQLLADGDWRGVVAHRRR